ncbi:MAG: energy-coupling factor transporter transmembrane protein EcfT [Clostridiales bacterium]|nr:energy-coupling factor transporter transmembrane protein EcfT [Clostridiales bacterium]
MRFDSYHPAINFIFFMAVIIMSTIFNQPVFLALSFICSFIYSIVLNGVRQVRFNLILILLVGLFALSFASYNHFGVTNLTTNFIGNQITLEALIYGVVLGVKASAVLMWFSCVHTILSSDKVIYLFGRITPNLSLFLSIILRMVPRIKRYAAIVHDSQKCIGRGISQGNLFRRIRNFFRIQSIVITWTLENFISISDSMRSRGYSLRGRTAFSIYRFDNRDRSFVVTLSLGFTILFAGALLDQTRILYNPEIILNRVTPLSFLFYITYMFVCLLPMTLQYIGEYRFKRAIYQLDPRA